MPRRICKYCNLVLSDKTSYSRHINHTCSKRPKPDDVAMKNEEKSKENITNVPEISIQSQSIEEVSKEYNFEDKEVSTANEPISVQHKPNGSFDNEIVSAIYS